MSVIQHTFRPANVHPIKDMGDDWNKAGKMCLITGIAE